MIVALRGKPVELGSARGKVRFLTTPITFAPDWGANCVKLWDLMAAIRAGTLHEFLEALLASKDLNTSNFDDARTLFCASLLRDVLRAGGRIWARDSRLLVTWPEWEGPEGRRNAQAAMV